MPYDTIPEIEERLREIPAEKREIGQNINSLKIKLKVALEKLGGVPEEAFLARNTSYEKLKTDIESQINNQMRPLLEEGRALIRLEIQLQEKLEQLIKKATSSSPPSQKPPAPPTSKAPKPKGLTVLSKKIETISDEINDPHITAAKLKSFQTILWPKNPKWYKGLGNFKKLIQEPYLSLANLIETCHETKLALHLRLPTTKKNFG